MSIVRDPVKKIPKIPGSSLAGVYRAYVTIETQRYTGCTGINTEKNSLRQLRCMHPFWL